jgi:thioredoxin 1
MHRRMLLMAGALAGMTQIQGAIAAEVAPYTQQAFAAAQADGKPILVHIQASWCPICAKQRPILGQLEQEPPYKSLVVLNVDFDTQKDIVRAMGANKQSTLIVFHGKDERGRSVGDSDAVTIQSLVAKSLT